MKLQATFESIGFINLPEIWKGYGRIVTCERLAYLARASRNGLVVTQIGCAFIWTREVEVYKKNTTAHTENGEVQLARYISPKVCAGSVVWYEAV